MPEFRTKKDAKGKNQVYPVAEGRTIPKNDDYVPTVLESEYRNFKGKRFRLYDDAFTSKEDAKRQADKLRKETGKNVRVKNLYGTWETWIATENDNSISEEKVLVDSKSINEKEQYSSDDFVVDRDTHDPRIPYILRSKDGEIEANLFWEKDNVELRGMVGENDTVHIAYPFANHGGGVKPPDPEVIKKSLVKRLKDQNIKKPIKKEPEHIEASVKKGVLNWEDLEEGVKQTHDHTMAKGSYHALNKRYSSAMSYLGRTKDETIVITNDKVEGIPAKLTSEQVHSNSKISDNDVVKIGKVYYNRKLVYATLEESSGEKILIKNGTAVSSRQIGKSYTIETLQREGNDDFPIAIKGKGKDEYYLIAPVMRENVEGA